MQPAGVLLLVFGVWFVYAGTKGLKPLAMLRAILANPGGASDLITGADAYAKATADRTAFADIAGTAGGLISGGLGVANDIAGAGAQFGDGIAGYAQSRVGVNPWAGNTVSAPYGQVNHGPLGDVHQGIDYEMPSGTKLPAVINGTAHHTSTSAGGNILRVDGTGAFAGWQTYYDHVRAFDASDGAAVVLGLSVVADSGGGANDPGKGDATGPHLHFEVHHNGSVVNPSTLWTWIAANKANIVKTMKAS